MTAPGDGDGPTPTPTQTDAAVETIRSRIIDLTIAPGSRLDEAMLLNHFQLGRTPAREAINRLAAEGFVRIAANRGGTFVRKLDLDEMGQIIVAHQLVESATSQLCRLEDAELASDLTAIQVDYRSQVNARRSLPITALNEQFHLRIARTIDNEFFNDFAQSTHRHVRRLLVHLYALEASQPDVQEAHFALNLAQHDAIIEAARDRDQDTLRTLLPEHARTTQDRLIDVLRGHSVGALDFSNVETGPLHDL